MSERGDKANNRRTVENPDHRKAAGAARVSVPAIVTAVMVCLIIFGLIWPWIRPR